jgi:mannose-6-phosphate isomerase-like protein (cupin superfamily)
MSYNPVRAKNFYRNTSKRPRRQDPHAGIKHSDIMRRQGMGQTLPTEGRQQTPHGFGATIFSGEDFNVRSEIIAAGNNLGFGVNEEADRVYQVIRGPLFVIIEGEQGTKDVLQVQDGGNFRAPRGLKHGVASSGTNDVELLVIESASYADTWQQIEDGVARTSEDLAAYTNNQAAQQAQINIADAPPARRRDQSKAKKQAVKEAAKRRRRQPKMAASPTPAQTAAAGQKVGRNASKNANSGNVQGVNPMPMGPGSDD